jgi:hypothetical protein
MALKDTNLSEEYPYIFLVEQSIHQGVIGNSADNPQYTLSLAWRYYKVLEDGAIVFKSGKPETYYDSDFYVSAITEYMSGDATDLQTLGAQQLSVKKIVESQTGRTLEVIG